MRNYDRVARQLILGVCAVLGGCRYGAIGGAETRYVARWGHRTLLFRSRGTHDPTTGFCEMRGEGGEGRWRRLQCQK